MTVGYSHPNYVPNGIPPYGRITTAVRKRQRRRKILDKIKEALRRDKQ